MTVKAFAKINLGLEIVRRRADGYHDIRTIFQTINLSDELVFKPVGGDSVLIEGDDPAVAWDETNLIYRAVEAVREKTGRRTGVSVRVKKRIPAGKGLGGGSADAAATLLALDKIWSLALPAAELAAMARSLGADVPYFLKGGLCLGEGIGDVLTELPDLPLLACVLVFPPFAIRTADIYAGAAPSLTSEGKPSKIGHFLESGDFSLLESDLERVIFKRYPELESIKVFFKGRGAMLTLVSGSGSAVYGLFAVKEEARRAREQIRGKAETLLTETLPREGYWAQLGAGV